jgi:hypothetical protein
MRMRLLCDRSTNTVSKTCITCGYDGWLMPQILHKGKCYSANKVTNCQASTYKCYMVTSGTNISKRNRFNSSFLSPIIFPFVFLVLQFYLPLPAKQHISMQTAAWIRNHAREPCHHRVHTTTTFFYFIFLYNLRAATYVSK